MEDMRWRRRTKELLYAHPEQARRLREEERHIIMAGGSYQDQRWRGGGVKDPTAMKALRLESEELRRLRRPVEAVRRLLLSLDTNRRIDQQRRALLELVYFRCQCSLVGAAARLGVSYRTAKRWNEQLLRALAQTMGWLEPSPFAQQPEEEA